jgi:hypothetical protein
VWFGKASAGQPGTVGGLEVLTRNHVLNFTDAQLAPQRNKPEVLFVGIVLQGMKDCSVLKEM